MMTTRIRAVRMFATFAGFCVLMGAGQVLLAQAQTVGLRSRAFNRPNTTNPEEVRADLLRLTDQLIAMYPIGIDEVSGFEPGIPRGQLTDLREQIENLPYEAVEVLATATDHPRLLEALELLEASASDETASLGVAPKAVGPEPAFLSALNPPAYSFVCPAPWSNSDILFGLKAGLVVLKASDITANFLCETLVVVAAGGGGTNAPGCIAAGISAGLVLAAETVIDVFDFCDGDIDSAEIEAAWKNTITVHGDLVTHDGNLANHRDLIGVQLAAHDLNMTTQHEEIKALFTALQGAIDENTARLKSVQAMQKQTIKLLLTPEGRRVIDETDVLTCLGDACPNVLDCPGGECGFPIKK